MYSWHIVVTITGFGFLLIFWFSPLMQRTKIISDLLIAVSKAERQEARMKVRQDSLRLGNVGVIRYYTN